MTRNKEFLNTYKEFETELRKQNIDSMSMEQDTELGDKFRICRLMRNYMAHNAEVNFIEATSAQVEFLQKQLEKLQKANDTIRKHIKTVNASTVTYKDRCTTALEKLIKLKQDKILVIGKNKYKIASIYEIAKAVNASKTNKMETIKTTNNFIITSPETLYSEIPENSFVICTSDGKITGKLLGTMIK